MPESVFIKSRKTIEIIIISIYLLFIAIENWSRFVYIKSFKRVIMYDTENSYTGIFTIVFCIM